MDYIDAQYINIISMHLEKFSTAGNGLHRFRCPICGDSAKDKTKTRGYLYEKGDKVLYFCHNCGSPEVNTLGKLIKFVSPAIYKDYILDKFGSKFRNNKKEDEVDPSLFKSANVKTKELQAKTKVENVSIKSDNIDKEEFEYDIDDDFVIPALSKPVVKKEVEFKNILSVCESLKDLSDDHIARKYLKEERKLPNHGIEKLYYVKDINLITNQIEQYKNKRFFTYDGIVIPFADFDGTINCIQVRILNKESKLRYVTLFINEDKTKAIYGLDVVDVNKTVYLLEGPFNSLFVKNAVASAGATQRSKVDYICKNIKDVVLVYDCDYRSNADVMRSLEKSIEDGFKVVIYDDVFKSNDDINDIMIRLKWTESQLMEYLKSRTFSGLRAKLELSKRPKPVKSKPTYNNKKSDLMETFERSIRR